MAPWRISHWFGLARHLPNMNSSTVGPSSVSYAKPEKLRRLPVRTMSQTMPVCARESLAVEMNASHGHWRLPRGSLLVFSWHYT
eukprot:690385-Prymnesium_polylepis.1